MAADFAGTWKLNLEKSKLQNNDLASETMNISKTGPNSYTTAADTVSKSCEQRHTEVVSSDGKVDDESLEHRGRVGVREAVVVRFEPRPVTPDDLLHDALSSSFRINGRRNRRSSSVARKSAIVAVCGAYIATS
jgi:hypothetical protein